MITDSGNMLAQSILDLAKQKEDMATMHARSYASTDDPKAKVSFQREMEMAEFLRKLHSDVCRGLHAVEAEMHEKAKTKEVKA